MKLVLLKPAAAGITALQAGDSFGILYMGAFKTSSPAGWLPGWMIIYAKGFI